jgi:hypothetical protein
MRGIKLGFVEHPAGDMMLVDFWVKFQDEKLASPIKMSRSRIKILKLNELRYIEIGGSFFFNQTCDRI